MLSVGVAISRAARPVNATVATSYANAGGTGNRTASITITSAVSLTNAASMLVNGVTTAEAGPYFTNLSTTNAIRFDFGISKTIDEAKFYQSTTASHGTFKWQGSHDDATFADIGSTFTLGGALTQTLTSLNGNVTAYRYYRLLQTAGQASSGPYLYEFEFKIG